MIVCDPNSVTIPEWQQNCNDQQGPQPISSEE
jgi:hypothetical protein